MADVEQLIAATRRLATACANLSFGPPVSCVYNPLEYAWHAHEQYLRRFEHAAPKLVLVGMNPGPFGMLQTGVPFGDVAMVRDWLHIAAPVAQPAQLHPKRPISGFDCRRREVSGSRVWGWAQARYGEAQRFLDDFFVLNYCPLAFFEASGLNRTPDKLPRAEQAALFDVCDQALAEVLQVLSPRWVVGIGRFAEQRAAAVAGPLGMAVCAVTHPSPANPQANKGWAPHMDALMTRLGMTQSASSVAGG
jgi:single-strand selective monofunctional uracil DNA glycosylase